MCVVLDTWQVIPSGYCKLMDMLCGVTEVFVNIFETTQYFKNTCNVVVNVFAVLVHYKVLLIWKVVE